MQAVKVLVFAKAPEPGRVKTRLAAAIGEEAAVRLHTAFTGDILEELTQWFDVELHVDGCTGAWGEFDVARREQRGEELGGRMFNAVSEALAQGCGWAVVVGADVPAVTAEHVRALLREEAEVVFGPAEDGGYWAVACKRVAEGMFEGVEWGTARALSQSAAACGKAGLGTGLGPVLYDVDCIEGLRRLAGDEIVGLRRRTRKALASIFGV